MGGNGCCAWGESTRRSEIDAEHLTAQLRQVGIAQLQESEEEEVWLIADGSDLCKPYAQEMPYLMEVLDENEQVVPGYRTLTVIGVTRHPARDSLPESIE